MASPATCSAFMESYRLGPRSVASLFLEHAGELRLRPRGLAALGRHFIFHVVHTSDAQVPTENAVQGKSHLLAGRWLNGSSTAEQRHDPGSASLDDISAELRLAVVVADDHRGRARVGSFDTHHTAQSEPDVQLADAFRSH
eukprot:CAMPEP_0170468516 /NCGR_PEP_ID=MMETSP0123-20130129/11667_1 /TAXON_ID=182087 /ORGANISM="Favella ehrenbergii, Strain Fehren 1" /LENGTH=140 /DNA_ID=CAMNT_0010735105 /DNA_START=121 /DNA_END=541 /DNA_ORIENTATION=-